MKDEKDLVEEALQKGKCTGGIVQMEPLIIKDIIQKTIEELQSLLQEGDRLTIEPKNARLVYYGELKALGTEVVASFLAREK